MNKSAVKETMLALSASELEHAREHYEQFLASARLDRSEPIETDERAQAETASELAEAFEQPVHDYETKIDRLRAIDFGPKSEVGEGAIVTVGARHFVIAVSTARFEHEGVELIGISTQAPIYKAMEGKEAGDDCTFNGRTLTIDEVI